MVRNKKLMLVVLLLVGSGAVWLQRDPLLAWYYVHRLTEADVANRDVWIERVLSLDAAALHRLVAGLRADDETVCANLEAALLGLAKRGDGATASGALARLRDAFSSLSMPGKACALRTAAATLSEGGNVDALAVVATDLLKAAEPSEELRPDVLRLLAVVLERMPGGAWHETGRTLARAALEDANPQARIAALRLVLSDALKEEKDLLTRTPVLLRDPAPEVRRAAVVALGALPDVVTEDELLPLLHDADPEVQQLCELALRSRGLQDDHLEMARLISDESPTARLQVLQHLRTTRDLDPGVWLRRLSQDTSPAVRAAAVRAAGDQNRSELRDRLVEMSRGDASATVRELASFYLSNPRK